MGWFAAIARSAVLLTPSVYWLLVVDPFSSAASSFLYLVYIWHTALLRLRLGLSSIISDELLLRDSVLIRLPSVFHVSSVRLRARISTQSYLTKIKWKMAVHCTHKKRVTFPELDICGPYNRERSVRGFANPLPRYRLSPKERRTKDPKVSSEADPQY